ncbi:MAG: DUF3095 domain-containing protein, partial [Leptolyngbyaceae cyanobacterium CRU_2_3]|nr:DUF3095 domain-containing protein [Leptolyngbyaceae cyanobacterium CRU_2_3]
GTSFCLEPARRALLAARQQALDSFGMNLRVGVVPVEVIRADGYQLKVAKFRVTDNYSQASFTGGGLTYATQLVKADIDPNLYRLDTYQPSFKADFSGLECRWQDIPSQPGHTLSLIVSTNGFWAKSSDTIYAEVLGKIQTIFGGENGYHPVRNSSLNLSFNLKKLSIEAKMRSPNPRYRLFYLAKMLVENLLGYVLMGLKLKLGNVHWGRYKQDVSAATDYQKFDDILRMVISSSAAQIEYLTEYLERRFKAGELVYGLHVSDRTLMTCLVFGRDGHHTHFVDGADGGYTLAAKAFKQRMHKKVSNWRTYSRFVKLGNLSSFYQ